MYAGKELGVFGNVVRQLLGDAQQRIVFRAQVSKLSSVCVLQTRPPACGVHVDSGPARCKQVVARVWEFMNTCTCTIGTVS